ncbi:hypothetical protein BBJ28_00003415 [Nothophytophthora sp. Chile5]|nr:hypothetical protein BBJ28_00003415 [Nothophytophthora sp. Chile5]
MADLLAAAAATPVSSEALSGRDDNGAVIGLTPEQLADMKEQAIAYAAAHGLLVGWRDPSEAAAAPAATFTHIPFCLLPVQQFPKTQFELGVTLSPLYGRLVDRVSRDIDWLHACVQSVVAEDQFTGRLLALSRLVQSEGVQQKAYLGIHRSDYMLHEPEAAGSGDSQRLLQVELNTISSSFGCISSLVSDMHRFVWAFRACGVFVSCEELTFVVSRCLLMAADSLSVALQRTSLPWKATTAAIVLFVVQPNEANAIDQRWLEYNLWEHHGVSVLRRTMAEINARGVLKKREDGKQALDIDGHEVAVAYFRAGYTPNDYPSEQEWAGRTLIERSFAIKCPSIAYHLAGTKKVQQVLAEPSVLCRFMTEEEAKQLETSFAGLYGLEKDAPATARVKQMAVENPRAFVLKPQREGGGNNLYGDEVAAAIQRMSPTELESFILMARIFPKENAAVLVRNSATVGGTTISELGMYIASLFDADGKEIVNKHAGHLLRTKLAGTDEGGVATGFSVVSSPLMENEGVGPRESAAERALPPSSGAGDQLFNVVYDPRFDRFFLEDEAVHNERNRTLDRKTGSIPWEEWILPPKSQRSHKATASHGRDNKIQNVGISEQSTNLDASPTHLTSQSIEETSVRPMQLPQLDFSAFAKPSTELEDKGLATSKLTIKNPADITAIERKKMRIPDYTAHFERTNNQRMAQLMVAAEAAEQHEVKWNGDALRVRVAGLRPGSDGDSQRSVDKVVANEELRQDSADAQWLGSTYDLKNLMRVRAHGDGFRGNSINSACRFVPLSSSSESSDSEQESESPQQATEEDSDVLPVFFRGDRVLFQAKRRWFKGTIRRRIASSDFYDVRADNGSLLEAVVATNIQLLEEPDEVRPRYRFVKGDKVLWTPERSEDEQQTYKARVMQVRSLGQFDLLLRTGRIVKKVPYEQLQPRDAVSLLSATTAKHW